MNETEMLSLLKSIAPILDKAFDYDGDVFGMLNNYAVDVSIAIEKAIEKLSKWLIEWDLFSLIFTLYNTHPIC